jgi:DNA repair protein RadD
MGFVLRPYQAAAVEAGVTALNGGVEAGVLIEPTGSGKSIIIANIINRVGGPVLVFQPSKEILLQNANKLLEYGYFPSIYSASMKERKIGDITLATIGSVVKNAGAFTDVRSIIVDECDLVNPKGGMYQSFLKALPQARVLGLTATPFRMSIDGYGGAQMKFITRTRPRIFTDVAHVTQIGDLQKQGFLSPLKYYGIPGFDKTKLKANSGMEYTDRSVQLYFDEISFRYRVAEVVNRLLAAGRRRILVFTAFVEDAEDLAARVPETRTVSGTMAAGERDAIIEGFRSGQIPVVANVGVLTAGFDYPELDTVVLARPTQSLRVMMQQIGRVVRPHPDKPEGWVVDMVDLVSQFGRLEEMVVRPGGATGAKWAFVTKGGRAITNAYLNGAPQKAWHGTSPAGKAWRW